MLQLHHLPVHQLPSRRKTFWPWNLPRPARRKTTRRQPRSRLLTEEKTVKRRTRRQKRQRMTAKTNLRPPTVTPGKMAPAGTKTSAVAHGHRDLQVVPGVGAVHAAREAAAAVQGPGQSRKSKERGHPLQRPSGSWSTTSPLTLTKITSGKYLAVTAPSLQWKCRLPPRR